MHYGANQTLVHSSKEHNETSTSKDKYSFDIIVDLNQRSILKVIGSGAIAIC